jgi:ubiquinone/menaquinone biosynthesis C-methylase UbiE
VLDLACGRGGGLAFLAEHFGIAKAVGVDFCPRSITFANDTFKDFSACPLTFIQGDIEYLPQCMPNQNFDLILSVESWHALPFPRSTLKQAKDMLSDSDSPRLIIADGFLNSMLAELENDFKLYFEIEQQIDISYNVRSARHLGAERMDKILEHANQNRDLFKWTSRYCQSMLPGEFMSSPI